MNPRHDWNRWESYQQAHYGRLRDYLDHFIIEDHLTPTLTATMAAWIGFFLCVDGLEIRVRKYQDVDRSSGRLMVRTRRYSYQALRRVGTETRKIFRYDNVHTHYGHSDAHHRHRFDEYGGEIEPVQYIGVEDWPTLGDVIDELHAWWVNWKASQLR